MMKAVITLLILGLLFIHGEALQCYKGSCDGGSCSYSETTCSTDANRCFTITMSTRYYFNVIRGCTTSPECASMKSLRPSTICCSTDLCN
ncbi:hypothetical protein AB205_0005560 [Aquarana catesbeiana]|uniref:Snake toxin/toxin-like domain-containing protein n=1 Tax=Aquarana catesbeiana TaxID=8400 RepID=A0A2G9S6A5_AQUCT|nr:hypothetical protein AB205_0005560 [Aquarana catesbeiana]